LDDPRPFNIKERPVDFLGTIVSGLLTTVAYLVIFLGVYKLFQIASELREIKDLVASARRVPSGAAPFTSVSAPALMPETAKVLPGEDSAAAYAEHLLRTVNAGQRTESAPQEVR
jgi:hypothetical protein